MKRRLLTVIVPVMFLAFAAQTPTLIAQSTGTFTATGNMNTGRYGHSATLLRDGRVLIAGGFTDASGLSLVVPFGGQGLTASAELYNPATGGFTATGNMTAARAYHTATLLPDGRVLIASGWGMDRSADSLATAELYDPSTGTFTATGNMSTHSFNDVNTATLLRDGRVLIAGVSRAELYDPGSGTFTVTGNMTMPPAFARSTLLPDGRVLFASLVNATVYDPATGSFTPTVSPTDLLPTGQAVLLPNGKVLLAGGWNDDPGAIDGAELYDSSTGTFAGTGKMTVARSNLTMTLLSDGKALVAGGSSFLFTPPGGNPGLASVCCLNSVELYDPETGVFTAAGTMSTGRAGHTATRLQNGQVLMVGGSGGVAVDATTLGPGFSGPFPGGAVALATAELYTPAQASLPTSWVQVISKNSGKCLDVTGGPSATDPGTPIQQWACWGGSNQAFLFTPVEGGYEITAQNSGLQLDVTGGPAAVEDGVHVIQWPYWGGSNEIWQVLPVADGYYKIVALNSGKCLDVSEISPSDGAAVQQWSCWGGDNQSWHLVPNP